MDPQRRSFLRGRLARPDESAASDPPRPPWALRGDSAFTAVCTRCGDCLPACPRGVLVAGDGGFPEIRFEQAGCSLCGDCANACRTGAIDRARTAPAFLRRIHISDRCLNQRGTECRVCGDACDARALRFRPARGGISGLQVLTEACTGCGECLALCPAGAMSLR